MPVAKYTYSDKLIWCTIGLKNCGTVLEPDDFSDVLLQVI